VKEFLRNQVQLSRNGRVRLFVRLDSDLRQNGDRFRNEPGARLTPDSSRFRYFRLFYDDPDHGGDGSLHLFRFVVDDSSAVVGVLRVIYADEVPPPSLDFEG
jgi:hypothetical protein